MRVYNGPDDYQPQTVMANSAQPNYGGDDPVALQSQISSLEQQEQQAQADAYAPDDDGVSTGRSLNWLRPSYGQQQQQQRRGSYSATPSSRYPPLRPTRSSYGAAPRFPYMRRSPQAARRSLHAPLNSRRSPSYGAPKRAGGSSSRRLAARRRLAEIRARLRILRARLAKALARKNARRSSYGGSLHRSYGGSRRSSYGGSAPQRPSFDSAPHY